jgi:hypothetical protein
MPRSRTPWSIVFRLALALAAAAGIAACDEPEGPASTGPAPSPPASSAPAGASKAGGPLIEWTAAPEGDLAPLVVSEVERAKKDGRRLLVYVGAAWCEPCKRFHDAADAGEIEGLPRLRLLELDLDRDGDRLAAAGYGSKMIPLFALPGPDGRGNDARIEGSVKGAGAVRNLVPRLSALLARGGGS